MGLQSRPAGFGLSFVDMVSGGFGAAFFLFLIFASLPIEEQSQDGGGGSRFVEIWMTWPKGPKRAEVYLKHNDSKEIRLTSGNFEEQPGTGRLVSKAQLDVFWESGTSSGFSWFGSNVMENSINGDNAIRLRFINPCSGTLKIGGAIHGRSLGSDWLTATEPAIIKAKFTIVVSNGYDERQVFEGTSELSSSVKYATLKLNDEEYSAVNLGDTDEDWAWCS